MDFTQPNGPRLIRPALAQCISQLSEQNLESPNLGEIWYNIGMRIISRRRLIQFWESHPDAEQPLRAWFAEAKKADWKTPTEIKSLYRNASILANNRVVFNIKGNDYRLVVAVGYRQRKIFIRFVGTHDEYDKIDATEI